MGLDTSRVRAWRVLRVCVVPGAYAWARPKPRPLRTRSAGRRRGTMMPLPPAPSRLDRIRFDRTHIVGSIDPVNPVYIYKVEQIQAVDGIADGDSHQPRSALSVAERAKVPQRSDRHAGDGSAEALF